MEIGIWKVTSNRPQRYQRGRILLESQLEDWIEQDPSLLSPGLHTVGRQLKVEAGRLDLLGLDPAGHWVIVEIKRGDVRRDTITQAIDYAACIHEMSDTELQTHVDEYLKAHGNNLKQFLQAREWDNSVFNERNIIMYVVGTSNDPHLERMTGFLKNIGSLAINVVNFDIFESEQGEQIMVRQLTGIEIQAKSQSPRKLPQQSTSLQPLSEDNDLRRLFDLADKNGVGQEFRFVYEEATKHGLFPRLYKWSIMYTPPTNKARCLIVCWVNRRNKVLDIYIASSVFAEFFPIPEQDAITLLGKDERYSFNMGELTTTFNNLDKLFVLINKNKA